MAGRPASRLARAEAKLHVFARGPARMPAFGTSDVIQRGTERLNHSQSFSAAKGFSVRHQERLGEMPPRL